MWFLWELFDDVIDIATVPVKLWATVVDTVLYPFEEWGADFVRPTIDKARESVRINK